MSGNGPFDDPGGEKSQRSKVPSSSSSSPPAPPPILTLPAEGWGEVRPDFCEASCGLGQKEKEGELPSLPPSPQPLPLLLGGGDWGRFHGWLRTMAGVTSTNSGGQIASPFPVLSSNWTITASYFPEARLKSLKGQQLRLQKLAHSLSGLFSLNFTLNIGSGTGGKNNLSICISPFACWMLKTSLGRGCLSGHTKHHAKRLVFAKEMKDH